MSDSPHDDDHAGLEATIPAEPNAPGPSAEAALDRGATLGRYTVLERIGAGGMGVVYGAFDPQLDRKVALKVMHPGSAQKRTGTDGRSRLLREAQAMAKLSHPNVITVHDVGTFGERVFVAMEFIDGATLREWLDQSGREWQDAVDAFVKAGRGLAAAHAAGIVHRDFKPDNVLIGHDGRVLVMDFGLARATSGPSDSTPSADQLRVVDARDMSLTRTGALLGTPAYMAPEQHKGGKPDPHADQFSFCVALYESLYGERPFEGNSVTSLAMNVLDGHVRHAPKGSRVPSWLRTVVIRGLSRDPSERYPSMDALLAELQRDPDERRPPWIALGVAVSVAGIITAAYLASRPEVDDRCATRAERGASTWTPEDSEALRKAYARTDVPHAEAMAKRVAGALETWTAGWTQGYRSLCQERVVPGPRAIALEEVPGLVCLEAMRADVEALVQVLEAAHPRTVLHAVGAIEALPDLTPCRDPMPPRTDADLPDLRKSVARGTALLAAGDTAEVRALAAGLIAVMKDSGQPELVARLHILAASAARRRLDSGAAARRLEEAVVYAARAGQPRLEAEAWIDLTAVVGTDLERLREGERLALAAESALARAESDTLLRARLARVRGGMALAAGRWELARVHFDEAANLLSEHLAADDPRLARALEDLGVALEGLGRYEQAMQTYSRALSIREQVLGTQHPLVGRTLAHLGTAMLGADFPRKADASFVRATWVLDPPVDERPWPPLAPDDPEVSRLRAVVARDLADIRDRQGLLHRAREEFDAAERLHRAALGELERERGGAHRDLGYPLVNLGLALADQERWEESVVPLRRALEIWSASLPVGHPDLAIAHLDTANSLWALGQHLEAKMEYERALEVAELSLPEDHPLIGYALTGIGRGNLALGQAAAALEPLERALAIRDREGEDKLNIAETSLALAQALWADKREPGRARELVERARELVGAPSPTDPAGIEALLDGAEVVRFTDQLAPAGLGTTNRTLRSDP